MAPNPFCALGPESSVGNDEPETASIDDGTGTPSVSNWQLLGSLRGHGEVT